MKQVTVVQDANKASAEKQERDFRLPNAFFHIAMAYAILRHNGVDVGKMDFLGPINLVDA